MQPTIGGGNCLVGKKLVTSRCKYQTMKQTDFKILSSCEIAPRIFRMEVYAPLIAASALPGQFVIVRTDALGERIPLTICDYDTEKGYIVLVTQIVGRSSDKICSLKVGDCFADVVGPLGNPSDFVKMNPDELAATKWLFVAGGVGTAPVYPQAKWLHQRGIQADVIIGARNKSLFTYVDEMRQVANVHLCTDDGSEGFHGLVTELMADLVNKQGKHFDRVVIIGPMIMMKFAARAASELGIPSVVSLNALMVDGTGMCGACRVSVGGKTLFTCVDGPEFDGSLVDFDEAMRRQNMYKGNKKTEYDPNHKCECHG